jgi:hypothetical protein
MPQPTSYSKTTNFAQDEANNVGGRSTVRTTNLDAELRNIETTLDETLSNLALIQRDDGKIRDGAVEFYSLSANAKAALRGELTPRGAWGSPVSYVVNDVVTQAGVEYFCVISHTSGTFATDLTAGKWLLTAAGSAGAAAVSATAAATSVTAAAAQVAIAQEWATKTDGAVSGGEFSAKYHAQAAATNAGTATTQAAIATAAQAAAETAANSASNASATSGVYPAAASANVPRGLTQASVGAITPGAGGTNGTFALAWAGGNFSINPTGTFTVAGNALTAVTITGPGLYVGASPTVPTPSFAASAGLAGAAVALTAQFLIASGEGYWVQNADGRTLDRYENVGGVATADTDVEPILNGDALLTSVFFAGEPDALSAQTMSINTGDHILLQEVPYDGTVEAVVMGGTNGGNTVTMREFSRNGRTFTKVGADLGSAVLTTGNESTIRSNRAVSRGNYIAFSASIGVIAGIAPVAGRPLRSGGFIIGTLNGNPIVAGNATDDREPQVRVSVLANSAAVEAEALRAADFSGHAQHAVFGGGRRTLFVAGGSLARVVCYDDPAPCSGRVRIHAVGGPVGGWAYVTKQRRTVNDFEAISPSFPIELTAGEESSFDLDLRVEAGDYIAIEQTTGVLDYHGSGTAERQAYFLLAAGGIYAAAPSSSGSTSDFMFRYEVIADEAVKDSRRKVVVLGDSIWDAESLDRQTARFMEYELGDREVVNCAIGGTFFSAELLGQPTTAGKYAPFSPVKICEAIGANDYTDLAAAIPVLAATGKDVTEQYNKLIAIDWDTVDVLLIAAGTNDFAVALAIGTATDEVDTTIRGCVNLCVEYIRGTHPHVKVVFAAPAYRHRVVSTLESTDTVPNFLGLYLVNYVDAIVEQAALSHALCVDLWRTVGIGPENYVAMIPDGVHPTIIGCRAIGERVGKFIKYSA